MERYFGKKKDAPNSISVEQKRPQIELDLREIVEDPGNRKPIDEFHHDIRDEARRAYLQKGPYRPADHKFPKTKFTDYECVKLKSDLLVFIDEVKNDTDLAPVLILVTLLRRWFKVIDIQVFLWCIVSLNLH